VRISNFLDKANKTKLFLISSAFFALVMLFLFDEGLHPLYVILSISMAPMLTVILVGVLAILETVWIEIVKPLLKSFLSWIRK
jgi:hypothetical protein